LTSKGKPLSAYLEAKNHLAALDYLDSVVSEKTAFTAHLIRQYHAMLFDKIDRIVIGNKAAPKEVTITAGEYKKENNHVIRLDGQIRHFTDWLQVPGEMERLMTWYEANENALHPVQLASQLHHKFVSIHPFLDGNGRVGRLLLNTVLMQRGYTPAIIPVEEKKQYFESLQAADDGNYEALSNLIDSQVSKTLSLMLDVVEGRDAFDFLDLGRMIKNMAKLALEINQDLGAAVEAPEARAQRTATGITAEVERLLKDHMENTKAPGLSFTMQKVGTPAGSHIMNQLKNEIGAALPSTVFSVIGGTRTVPRLNITFTPFSGRYQVAMAASSSMGRFGANHKEVMEVCDLGSSIRGPISFEDWDKKAIHDFVLDYLKQMYLRVGQEIEQRKQLIAEEEAERMERFKQ
jgi:fido (protein-threonine AMPylation protein)